MRASAFERTTTYAVLAAFAIAVIYPILSIVFLALHQKEDLVTGFALPNSFDLHSFQAAWDLGDFATGFKSSFIVAATVTAVSAVLSIGTGYAFGTMRVPRRPLGLLAAAARDHLPVRGDGDPALLRLPGASACLNTYWALILPQIGQSVSFGTFWMRAFFRSSPRSLIEAARIDGAVQLRGAVARAAPAGAARDHDPVRARVHLHVERVPARPRADPGREPQQTAPLGLSFFAGTARAGDPTKVAAAAVLVALPIMHRLHLPPAALHPRHAGGSDQGVAWHASRSPTWAAAPPAPPARWRRSSTTGEDFDGSEVVLIDLDADRLDADPPPGRADGAGPRARHHDHRDDRPAGRRSTDVRRRPLELPARRLRGARPRRADPARARA